MRFGARNLVVGGWFTMFLTLAGVLGAPRGAAAAPGGAAGRVRDIIAALHGMEAKRLWPGFDLRRVPIAIYDGETTYLLGHPAPPAEFAPVAGDDGLRAAPGQYPAMRANTSAEIGGVLTATCLAVGDRPPAAWAAIIAHEAFHVFQRQTHANWTTNEMALFTYPSEDVSNLALARVEGVALERALAAPDPAQAACWARAALAARTSRFSSLPADAAGYERGIELVEGTASLVQYRSGDSSQPSITATDFAADATRTRAYAAGRTLGLLLDRFAPGWEERVQAAKTQPALDELLALALPSAAGAPPCAATPDETAEHRAAATRAVQALIARREGARREFETAPGWRLVVRAPEGASFGPQGFDPMNVVRLDGNQVLHTRWLKAGRQDGSIEVLNRRALTRAAGAHPLFSGFREVEVTGLPAEPAVTAHDGGGVTVQAEGVKAQFPRATIAREGQTITIQVR